MNGDLGSKVQFWAYDIFGYLLPGLMLLVGVTVSTKVAHEVFTSHLFSGLSSDLVILLAFSYVLGHIIAAASSFFLERVILRHTLRYPTYQMFKGADDTPKWKKFFFPGYFRPYSRAFQTEFTKQFESTFGVSGFDDHDRFWLCWSFIAAHHSIAYKRASHFLDLYGFERNMSMTFLLLGVVPWLSPWLGWMNIMNGYVWSIGAMIISFGLFTNYTKLLRRLNDETYRAFIVIVKTMRKKELTVDAEALS